MHKMCIWRLVKIEGKVSPHLVLASGVLLYEGMKSHFWYKQINLLKTKYILIYIKTQHVPRYKHFPPRL